jgi:hypothetical protein
MLVSSMASTEQSPPPESAYYNYYENKGEIREEGDRMYQDETDLFLW